MAVITGRLARGALLPAGVVGLAGSRTGSLIFFIVRRVLWLIPILFFVITITFVLMHLAPGSPWDRGGGRQLSQAVVDNLNARYGLNKPVSQQYLLYIWNVAHFDFGLSYQYQGKSVTSLLSEGWKYSATLGIMAFVVVVIAGVSLGVLAALRQNTKIDYIAMGFSTFAASFPNFVVGMLMVVLFSVFLYKWTEGSFFLPSADFALDDHLVLPVLTLSLLPTAYIARLTRASTLETIRQDYVRTAWAKGLPERLVVVKHVLKNSLIPVVTALGPLFASLVVGTVVVETIFNIPGIGRAFVTAIASYDYPMILATSVLFAIVVAVANLIVDVLYVFIDPRVRLS